MDSIAILLLPTIKNILLHKRKVGNYNAKSGRKSREEERGGGIGSVGRYGARQFSSGQRVEIRAGCQSLPGLSPSTPHKKAPRLTSRKS
jgi:hypothetical protein